MKRFLFLSVLIMTVLCVQAQKKYPAVINDPDGYTNVRSGQSAKSDIRFQIYDGEVFYYSPTNTNWYKVYTWSETEPAGYMYKTRIKPLKQEPITKSAVAGKMWIDYSCQNEYGGGCSQFTFYADGTGLFEWCTDHGGDKHSLTWKITNGELYVKYTDYGGEVTNKKFTYYGSHLYIKGTLFETDNWYHLCE